MSHLNFHISHFDYRIIDDKQNKKYVLLFKIVVSMNFDFWNNHVFCLLFLFCYCSWCCCCCFLSGKSILVITDCNNFYANNFNSMWDHVLFHFSLCYLCKMLIVCSVILLLIYLIRVLRLNHLIQITLADAHIKTGKSYRKKKKCLR